MPGVVGLSSVLTDLPPNEVFISCDEGWSLVMVDWRGVVGADRAPAVCRNEVSKKSSAGVMRCCWLDWVMPSLKALSIEGLAVRVPRALGVNKIASPAPLTAEPASVLPSA